MRYRPERRSCDAPVTVVITGTDQRTAQAKSVSSTGILIEGLRDLRSIVDVTLVSKGQEFAARVAWCSDGRAGLEFVEPQTKRALREAGLYPD